MAGIATASMVLLESLIKHTQPSIVQTVLLQEIQQTIKLYPGQIVAA